MARWCPLSWLANITPKMNTRFNIAINDQSHIIGGVTSCITNYGNVQIRWTQKRPFSRLVRPSEGSNSITKFPTLISYRFKSKLLYNNYIVFFIFQGIFVPNFHNSFFDSSLLYSLLVGCINKVSPQSRFLASHLKDP